MVFIVHHPLIKAARISIFGCFVAESEGFWGVRLTLPQQDVGRSPLRR